MSDLNKIVNELVGVVSENKKQRLSGPVSATLLSVFLAFNYKLIMILLYPQRLLPEVRVDTVLLKGLDARVKLISDYKVIFGNDLLDNIFSWTILLMFIFLSFSFLNKLYEALQSKVDLAGKKSGGHVDIDSIRKEEFARAEGSVNKKLDGYAEAMNGFDKTLDAINYVTKVQGRDIGCIKQLKIESPELWKAVLTIEESLNDLTKIVGEVKRHTDQYKNNSNLFFEEVGNISTKVLRIIGQDNKK